MVRLIAAITLISVCCQSSVVYSQTRNAAARPIVPASRTQANDAPEPAGGPLGNQPPRATVQPMPPELEKLLIAWAAASARIDRLEGEHLRRVYDLPFEVEKLSQGRFYYEKPDKGRINITPVQIDARMLQQRADGEVPTKKKKDGTPFGLKSDQEECWSCDGSRVYELDVANKQARVAQLPADLQGQNIMDSPLPFLFGMPPEKAKRRFEMSLVRLDAKTERAYLNILPRLPQDAASWASADVILDLKTFLPIAVQLVDPAGTKITVYSFSSLKVNENKWIDKMFDSQDPKTRFTPDLRGFNINMQDGERPEQMVENRPKPSPPVDPALVNVLGLFHSDALIQLERQGLKRDKENETANNIILEAGPAAQKPEDVYTVKEQHPPAGTKLTKDMKVRLTIWTKPEGNAKQ